MKKNGLILSGGGARTMAHLGIMKALEEQGVTFSKIAGTSAGAVIAVLYASGLSPDEIFNRFVGLKLWSFLTPVIPRSGFLDMSSVKKLLSENLPYKTFEELKMPTCIAATDLEEGTTICFSSGEIITPLLASCCIPVLYEPIRFQGRQYIDGGILNNLPIEMIEDDVDYTIALHSNPIHNSFKPTGVKSMIERTLMMAITTNVHMKKDRCDLFIEPPPLGTYKVLEFNKSEEIFQIGYEYAKENMASFDIERFKTSAHDISRTNTPGNS